MELNSVQRECTKSMKKLMLKRLLKKDLILELQLLLILLTGLIDIQFSSKLEDANTLPLKVWEKKPLKKNWENLPLKTQLRKDTDL